MTQGPAPHPGSRGIAAAGPLLLALLGGIGFALAFPRASLVPMAWLAPVPWLAIGVRVRPRRGFLLGFAFGAGFFGLLLGFVHGVLTHFTALPLYLTGPIWVLLVAYLALYPALFGAVLASLGRRLGDRALLVAPVVWVGLELARGIAIGGFPWGLAGYAHTGGRVLAQAASIGGISLVSLLLVAAWSALAILLLAFPPGKRVLARWSTAPGTTGGPNRSSILMASAILAAVAGFLSWGALRLHAHSAPAATEVLPAPGSAPRPGSYRVSLVQGGWGGDLDAEQARIALNDYTELTLQARAFAPDLVVWPESNAPYGPETTDGYLDRLTTLARATGAALLLGAVGEREDGRLTNSAYLVGEGGVLQRYDKIRLVQYGEYVPMQSLFPFIRKFVPEAGVFVAGEKVGLVRAPGRALGVAICYEVIFPEETRADARAGAELLVNITNDSWYPGSGPWQHAEFASFRSIETGLWAVRAASTGVTLVTDPLGRTVASGPLGDGVRYRLDAEIPALPNSGTSTTPFVRWGNVVGWACATMTAGLLAFLTLGNKIDRRRH